MKKRQRSFQEENSSLISLLYLDPRFKSRLSAANRERAENHIEYVLTKLEMLEKSKFVL